MTMHSYTSLASQFEEVLAQRRSQEAMITELRSYACEDRNDTGVNESLRKLDCLTGLGAIRRSVQDTLPTPEETHWLKHTKEKAEKLQRNLDLLLRRHICESARLTASKDEYDILVALLVPCEGQGSTIFAEQSLDPTGRCATGAEHTGIEALNVMETVMEYTRCTLAVVQGGVEFSAYRPAPPLPPLGDEGDSEMTLTTRRSFRNLFRRK